MVVGNACLLPRKWTWFMSGTYEYDPYLISLVSVIKMCCVSEYHISVWVHESWWYNETTMNNSNCLQVPNILLRAYLIPPGVWTKISSWQDLKRRTSIELELGLFVNYFCDTQTLSSYTIRIVYCTICITIGSCRLLEFKICKAEPCDQNWLEKTSRFRSPN